MHTLFLTINFITMKKILDNLSHCNQQWAMRFCTLSLVYKITEERVK